MAHSSAMFTQVHTVWCLWHHLRKWTSSTRRCPVPGWSSGRSCTWTAIPRRTSKNSRLESRLRLSSSARLGRFLTKTFNYIVGTSRVKTFCGNWNVNTVAFLLPTLSAMPWENVWNIVVSDKVHRRSDSIRYRINLQYCDKGFVTKSCCSFARHSSDTGLNLNIIASLISKQTFQWSRMLHQSIQFNKRDFLGR